MTLCAIDVPIPAGLLVAGSLLLLSVWYWHRLGGEDFDVTTRALRRGTLILAVLSIFALLRAASFVDSEVSPRSYVIAWLSALGLMFLTVLLLAVDILNSFRVHHRIVFRDTTSTAAQLGEQLSTATRESGEPDELEGTTKE